jgi:hypothetical protein
MQNLNRQIGQGNIKKESDAVKADKAIELMRFNVSIFI